MGLHPIDAITIATLNAAECYKLFDRGAIAPGKIADIVVIDDINKLNILQVYKKGVLVAENGKALFDAKILDCKDVKNTVHIKANKHIHSTPNLVTSIHNICALVVGGNTCSNISIQLLCTCQDIAVCDGYIAGVGDYSGIEEVDVRGKYLAPGFIDVIF